MAWFIRDGFTDAVSGPFDDAQLKALAANTKISRDTAIAKSADGPWYVAGRVNGLFPTGSETNTAAEKSVTEGRTGTSQLQPAPPATSEVITDANRSVASSDSSKPLIQAKDALFQVVWKLIRGTKEYSFHDDDFPVLAACLRIGAVFARLWFCFGFALLLLIGFVLGFDPNPRGLAAWCSLTGDDPRQFTTSDGYIEFTIWPHFWGILRHFLTFLAIMGGFEFVRVILAIEKNTRRMKK